MYLLSVADLKIGITPLVPGFDKFAGPYGTWTEEDVDSTDIRVEVTQDMIERERSMADSSNYSDAYLQTLAVYRVIAETAPALNRFLMHAAVIEYDGKAYAFTAPSGTGKSTHLRLWKQALGDKATIINGDKPLIRMCCQPNGTARFIVYGTPWCGKEGWNVNTSAPLAGICRIERGAQDQCHRVENADALDGIMHQVYMPNKQSSALATLSFIDALLQNVPMYTLSCTMNQSAAKASFETMTGQPLPGRKH